MEQIRVSYRLVATITCLVCLGFSVGMCSESDALIKTYVSSSLPSKDDLVHSANLKVPKISGWEWLSLVIESEVPVMVMFTENSCDECLPMTGMLEKLDLKFKDRFKFYTLSIIEEIDMAQRYGVRTIPTTIVFKHGEEVARVEGYDEPWRLYELVNQFM